MSVFNILTGKSTLNTSLGKPRRRWKDNIRRDLKEMSINTRNITNETQNRDYWRTLVNAA